MPFKVNSEVSMMDLFAIGLTTIAALKMVFSYGPAIDANTVLIQNGLASNTAEIVHVKQEIERVERTTDKAVDELKASIDKVGDSVQETRKESAAGRQTIVDKLDQLIIRGQ